MYGIRYLLAVILVLIIVFDFVIPAFQNIFGYGFGTLLAIVVAYAFFFGGPHSNRPLL